jgi:hypothetical protein
MRTIVCGDAHGQPWLIQNVLDRSEYDVRKDRLIFVGDSVDIGYSALDCLNILLDNKAEILWGNHDLAYILGKSIWPQNQFDYDFYDKLMEVKDQIKVFTQCGNIFITHAGISEHYYRCFLGIIFNLNPKFENISDVRKNLENYINSSSLEELWKKDSPVWYRPNKSDPPIGFLPQIVGHTPPGWLAQTGLQLDNFISVDPYSTIGFDETRYRYVIIENNEMKLIDSNIKK